MSEFTNGGGIGSRAHTVTFETIQGIILDESLTIVQQNVTILCLNRSSYV